MKRSGSSPWDLSILASLFVVTRFPKLQVLRDIAGLQEVCDTLTELAEMLLACLGLLPSCGLVLLTSL